MLCGYVLQGRPNGDGCELVSTLCKYDLRRVIICFELGKGETCEAGMCLFRALDVWWRWRCILLLPLVAICLETIYLCIIWRMFVLCLL